jgi:hypothetical protein
MRNTLAALAVLPTTIPSRRPRHDGGVWRHAVALPATPWRAAPPLGGLLR